MTKPAIAVPMWPGLTEQEAIRARFAGQEPPDGVELAFIHNPLPETDDVAGMIAQAEGLAAEIYYAEEQLAAKRTALQGWANLANGTGYFSLSMFALGVLKGRA